MMNGRTSAVWLTGSHEEIARKIGHVCNENCVRGVIVLSPESAQPPNPSPKIFSTIAQRLKAPGK